MTPSVHLTQLTFSDGTTVDVGPNETIVFVGPNNAGKSVSLRDIHRLCKDQKSGRGVAVHSAVLSTRGTIDDLRAHLLASAIRREPHDTNPTLHGLEWGVQLEHGSYRWTNAMHHGLQDLTPVFCRVLTTEGRLQACNPPGAIDPSTSSYHSAIHYLQFDSDIETKISTMVRKAFGVDLVVNRNAGSIVPLHVGVAPEWTKDEDRVSKAWAVVRAALDTKKAEIGTAEVSAEIQRALEDAKPSPQFPRDCAERVRAALRRSSPWDLAKKGGMAFVPSGDATQAAVRLLDNLARIGVHVVPVGELEGFDRTCGDHGPGWVSEVLKKDLAESADLETARKFVEVVVG